MARRSLVATAAGLGVEAGTMMVADNVTGGEDISFGTWLEDVVMVGAFKAGEPSNFVKMGKFCIILLIMTVVIS